MKKIEIIPIAENKLIKRGIKLDWMEDTIRNPGQIIQGYGGRKVAQKKILLENKEYLLRIVYEETEESYIVITTYLTSQINRYWKDDNL